jgi:hypothetical protein
MSDFRITIEGTIHALGEVENIDIWLNWHAHPGKCDERVAQAIGEAVDRARRRMRRKQCKKTKT